MTAPRVLGRDEPPAALVGRWQGGPQTWLLSVSEYTSELEGYVAEKILDAQERERVAAFLRDEDRERYTAAHVGLRRLLGAYLDLEPSEVPFIREPCPGCGEPHGRPAVRGGALHFNMSHAADLVLFAFAGTPIGVDVERVQSVEVVDQIAPSLHPRERTELAVLPPAERPAAFARCWTRKEAYLKGLGTGLSRDPATDYVSTGVATVPVGSWSLADIPVDHVRSGYAAAWAVLEATRTDQ
ncbi:4'-phosphopantetheinyl transferase superfamily protein [Streptomyces sp. LX-29]|uniref:4'-phosphopantetheinyl transferase family protein n=1 Tax=Streptomyces sp. LX-29 TaxID=2900152 RepID=UPI00240E442C|nr:4'-phosphopantetheinyl transferase superfamily protein [Streptomyces sp. LX-29]WFB06779.1 4'-phosphopantetheinyl transferase superfamily protein [Streptomyces sp. LX-29]